MRIGKLVIGIVLLLAGTQNALAEQVVDFECTGEDDYVLTLSINKSDIMAPRTVEVASWFAPKGFILYRESNAEAEFSGHLRYIGHYEDGAAPSGMSQKIIFLSTDPFSSSGRQVVVEHRFENAIEYQDFYCFE